MRKFLFTWILLCCAAWAQALHVECVGTAIQLEHEGDTLLLFATAPELKTLASVGQANWYKLPDTINPIQTGTDYFYPEHGEGYMMKAAQIRDVFWVFDYQQLRPQIAQLEADLTCQQTTIKIQGEMPTIAYTRMNARRETYPRICTVTYMDAMWSDDEQMWVDSTAIEEVPWQNEMIVGASPVATDFLITDGSFH